jgi:ornithine carbamoyltransferase
MGSDQLPSSIV